MQKRHEGERHWPGVISGSLIPNKIKKIKIRGSLIPKKKKIKIKIRGSLFEVPNIKKVLA